MFRKILVVSLILTLSVSMSACGSSKKNAKENVRTEISEGKLKATSQASNASAKTVETSSKGTEKESTKADDNSVSGYYKLIKFISEGEDITAELLELQDMGSGIYMILNEDGTGSINMLGEITGLNWDDKAITVHDESEDTVTEYTFVNGEFTLKQGIDEMVFVKMTEDEIKAYENGDTNKTIDQITDDILDSAYDDAMNQIDEIADDAKDTIDDAADDASKEIEKASEEFEDALDGASTSLKGSLSVTPKSDDSSDNTDTAQFDSSYLPDLSTSKHKDVGYYEIMAFQENGTTYTKDQLKNAGVEFDMMLCPDGKGYAHFIGTYYDLSWDDGTIYVATDEGQEKMIYFRSDYDGKQIITISDSNIAMVFEYTKDADSTYEWQGNSGLRNTN
ncbi:hypothetical protein [Butyrivibrio sp. WCE2006]|uniref:hypothetical protein n=1 Tax=Butyrivibrio sp. WCE2006 TaxID=1410611 RepID=UPI0005D14321|nr:hypothetical protein [Butyrivibrio sp. WCE2006]